ncbi:hypothetical protein ACFWGM_31635, partial [Streptomyces roseolus]
MKTTDIPPADDERIPALRTDRVPVVRKTAAPAGTKREGTVLNVFSHGVLIIWAIMVVLPLLWAVMTSFKTDRAIFTSPWSLPDGLHFDSWSRGGGPAAQEATRQTTRR